LIKLADAVPGDENAIAALCVELDEFYGNLPEGSPAERAAQVRDVLFSTPPLAHVLVAWDDDAPAGLAAYSFLWPAAGLTASLYLKELYVAGAYRQTGPPGFLVSRTMIMPPPSRPTSTHSPPLPL